jgi:TolB protein
MCLALSFGVGAGKFALDNAPTFMPRSPTPKSMATDTPIPVPTAFGGGGLIAYTIGTSDGTNDLYLYDPDSKWKTRLTLSATNKHGYAFSPDGKQLVFSSNFIPPQSWIYVIDVDGGNLTPLVSDAFRNWSPAWSPDGKKIAFASDRSGTFNIFVMDSDGTNVASLTEDESEAPNWSPDGKKIVFQSQKAKDEKDKDGDYEIYVMNADGTDPVALTDNTANDMTPKWSPDGKKIAFYTERDGNGEIYLMNPDGSNPVNLTMNPSTDVNFSWSSDGKNLIFESNRSGSTGIYGINVETRAVSALTIDENASSPVWSP